MYSREEAINYIFEKHPGAVFVTNTGYISRAVYSLYPNYKSIFYMQGSMGLSPAIGLGIALNTDKDVVVLCGDASLLMHLGITHTIRDAGLENLFVYILDNEGHESVGGYRCSDLESDYCGISSIIKISNDGKPPRVGLECPEVTKNIKSFLL